MMKIGTHNTLPLLIVFTLGISELFAGSQSLIAQAQKSQDQIWEEQRKSITMKCLLQNPIKEYSQAIGHPTGETDEDIETCNHDMLHLLGVCELNNDVYTFCKAVNSYIDDNKLEQLDERPEQLSQETIDKINSFDWNGDGTTTGSDFVSK
jgi:hypothetical protein